jgi:hypothetical protein
MYLNRKKNAFGQDFLNLSNTQSVHLVMQKVLKYIDSVLSYLHLEIILKIRVK